MQKYCIICKYGTVTHTRASMPVLHEWMETWTHSWCVIHAYFTPSLGQATFCGCRQGGVKLGIRISLLTPILPLIVEPGSPSHLHRPTQMEGLKLQQCRLQISLHSPHMPDRGEERITGFTASGLPFSLPRSMAQPYQQIIITAHKDMEERRKM